MIVPIHQPLMYYCCFLSLFAFKYVERWECSTMRFYECKLTVVGWDKICWHVTGDCVMLCFVTPLRFTFEREWKLLKICTELTRVSFSLAFVLNNCCFLPCMEMSKWHACGTHIIVFWQKICLPCTHSLCLWYILIIAC